MEIPRRHLGAARIEAVHAHGGTLVQLTEWSLVATVAAMPLYVVRWHYGPLPTTLLETLVLMTVALYTATLIAGRGPLPRRSPLDLPIAVFLVAGVIGVIVAPDHRGALGIFRAYLVEPVAIYYIASAVLRDQGAIARLLVVGAASLSLYAVIDLMYFGHALVTHTLRPGHAAAAFNVDPNSVALFVEPPLAIAAAFALFGRGRWRWFASGAFALLVLAEIATLSRGGLLALAALGLIGVMSLPSTRLRVALIAAAAAGGVLLLNLPLIGPRLLHAFDAHNGTVSVRLQIWAASLRMLREHPVFGAGLNAYQATMAPFRAGDRYLVPEPYPHDIFLTSWSELGLLGVIAFSAILLLLLIHPWRALRRADDFHRPLLWGSGAAFAVILVHGLVDSPYWKNDLSVEFWIIAAVELISVQAVARYDRSRPWRPPRMP